MKTPPVIDPTRIRTTEGSFAFIPHRFLRAGFWRTCGPAELVVYFFLVLAADRHGMSFYGREKTALLCGLTLQELMKASDGLEAKSLIVHDGPLTQVLALPEAPVRRAAVSRHSDGKPQTVAEELHTFTLKLIKNNRRP